MLKALKCDILRCVLNKWFILSARITAALLTAGCFFALRRLKFTVIE